MNFVETKLPGVFAVEMELREDERGFFARAWCEREFKAHGLVSRMVQGNVARTKNKGTVRGLHYQESPHEEAKLIRCISGSIFDVIIDLRPDSSTYGQWIGMDLSAESYKMLYVPEGCAHGYQALEGDTEVFYLVSAYYSPAKERGIRWNDPAFNIDWPIEDQLRISEKDSAWSDSELRDR